MFDVGEDVFHGSRYDTRLVVISRLIREIKRSALLQKKKRRVGSTHQRERLSRGGLPISKHHSIITLHSGDDVFSSDLVVHGLVLGAGNEFVKMEFWRGGGGRFCVLRIEFDGLGARG